MKKIIEKHIQLYDAGDGFMVEIHIDNDAADPRKWIWNAWLYKDGYGVKSFMFGVSDKQLAHSLNSFVEMVESNLEQYKEAYNEEYGE